MKTQVVIFSSVGVLIGGIVGVVCAYFFVLRPVSALTAQSMYVSAIAQARLLAVELQLVRDGETGKLVDILESSLDAHLIDAANIEAADQTYRDKDAERQLQSVRQYRAKYPLVHTDRDIQDKIARMLTPRIALPSSE